MPLSNKIRGKKCPSIIVDPVQVLDPLQPQPKRRGRPKKIPEPPAAPTAATASSDFPEPAPKKARKPRVKKNTNELLDQVPVKKQKQKVPVEIEVEPVITVKQTKKPRMTKAQKQAMIFQEEQSASEEESEETDIEDSDDELDRAIERLAKIKALQQE